MPSSCITKVTGALLEKSGVNFNARTTSVMCGRDWSGCNQQGTGCVTMNFISCVCVYLFYFVAKWVAGGG